MSHTGKYILTKSVEVSILVYPVSCFKLPKQITNEITFLLVNFWWDKGEHNKGISWIALKTAIFFFF